MDIRNVLGLKKDSSAGSIVDRVKKQDKKLKVKVNEIERKINKKNKNLDIEFYAIAQYRKRLEINLFSLDDCFNIIGDSSFPTVEQAIAELEPDNISYKDWKLILHN